jgi:hypothetical protein
MSIFASRTQLTVPLPFDEGQTVTIRRLPGRKLEKARLEKQIASQEFVTRMGGQEFRKQLNAVGDTETQKKLVAEAQADPLNSYDAHTVAAAGIVAWSYPEPVTPEAIEDLDGEALEFLAREILKLSKPSLFQTVDEAAAVKKTASDSSSVA